MIGQLTKLLGLCALARRAGPPVWRLACGVVCAVESAACMRCALIRRYAWVTKPPVGVRALQPSRISLRFLLVVRARSGFGVMQWVVLRLPLRITHRCLYILHLIILRRPIHGAIIGYTLVNLVGLHFDFPLHFGVPLARYTSMSRYMLCVGVPLWVTLRRFTTVTLRISRYFPQ